MTKDEQRLRKLPKWAQDQIQKLHEQLALARVRFKQLNENTPSKIWYAKHVMDSRTYIDENSKITFQLTPKNEISFWLVQKSGFIHHPYIHLDTGFEKIVTEASGGVNSLKVYPKSVGLTSR